MLKPISPVTICEKFTYMEVEAINCGEVFKWNREKNII